MSSRAVAISIIVIFFVVVGIMLYQLFTKR
jgi:hypothetical protein